MYVVEKYLVTANGRIVCLRCTATSKRTSQQCAAPAEKSTSAKNQRCRFHGARSTGPKTVAGIQRIRDANTKHGNETKEAREERSKKNLWFAQAEDVMTVLDMRVGLKNRGRKPNGYQKIKTLQDVKDWVSNDSLNLNKASSKP